jgi:hypothetical protein
VRVVHSLGTAGSRSDRYNISLCSSRSEHFFYIAWYTGY